MLISWKTKQETLDVGNNGEKMCPHCEKNREYRLVLKYTCTLLYGFFGRVSNREFFSLCSVCSRGNTVHTAVADSNVTKSPIGFMDRHGLIVFIVGLILIVTFFTMIDPNV